MESLSPLQKMSGCLIAINLFAINLIVLITCLIQKYKEEEFPVGFRAYTRQSQVSKILDDGSVKVAIKDNKAYWSIENILYKADIDKDGKILNQDAERVDVFSLSEKEVTALVLVIDSLNS